MNVLRFSDLCAQGKAQGQRVFIRADLNVPQDDDGRITEDTRIRASVPCIRMALDAGADFLKTSTGKTPISATPQAARLPPSPPRRPPPLHNIALRCPRSIAPLAPYLRR